MKKWKDKRKRLLIRFEWRQVWEELRPMDYWEHVTAMDYWSGFDDDFLEYDFHRQAVHYGDCLGLLPPHLRYRFPNFITFINKSIEHGMDVENILYRPRAATLLMIWLARVYGGR